MVTVFRQLLDRGVRKGLLVANPLRSIRVRWTIPGAEDRVQPWLVEELQRIFAAARRIDPESGTMLRLWLQSGGREGEVLALTRERLDLARGEIDVRHSFTAGIVGPTKTRRTRRVSILHPVAAETATWQPGSHEDPWQLLDELRARKVQTLARTEYLFGGARPWPLQSFYERYRRILTAADVQYRNPEQFRHTFASTLLSRGAPPTYVQAQGGWRSAAVLFQVYARWIPTPEVVAPVRRRVHGKLGDPNKIWPLSDATQARPGSLSTGPNRPES
jgi:integrase